jgi:hypothetical protein
MKFATERAHISYADGITDSSSPIRASRVEENA